MAVSARARELFLAELAQRGLAAEPLDDGTFRIVVGDTAMTINLENKGREFDRTEDEEVIRHFVAAIQRQGSMVPTSWQQARDRVYFVAEPSDYEFGETCRQEVSDQVVLALAYLTDPEMDLVWMTPSLLAS